LEKKVDKKVDNVGKGKLYEFFTPEYICRKMWDLAYMYGFNPSDKVLEPSAGTGNMIADAPVKSNVTVFELKDEYLSDLKNRFPSVISYNQAFETAYLEPPRFNSRIKNNSWLASDFGLVIANPPYGKATGYYKDIVKMKGQTEHWFILNTLKFLKPGGIGIYIIPSGFIRNGNTYTSVKSAIFELASLIDIYRLPNNVFGKTSIGTDIIVLKKK